MPAYKGDNARNNVVSIRLTDAETTPLSGYVDRSGLCRSDAVRDLIRKGLETVATEGKRITEASGNGR